MTRASVASFVQEQPRARGVHEAPIETARELFVTVKSVGMQESYLAMSSGHNPEIVLVLEHAFEYHGEKIIDFGGVRYNVLRTYLTKFDQLEITLERSGLQRV